MSFAPSEFSAPASDDLGEELGDDLGNFLTTAWRYYFPPPLVPAPAAKVKMALEDATKRPPTGGYIDVGYVYFYNRDTHTLTIVFSPKSGTRKIPVSAGTAFDAIFAKVVGAGKPSSTEEIKALRTGVAKASAAAAAARSSRTTASSVGIEPSTAMTVVAEAPASPFYTRWWFLAGVGVVGAGAIWWFTRSKS